MSTRGLDAAPVEVLDGVAPTARDGRAPGARARRHWATLCVTACYLYAREDADTTEHVVPRCLYAGKLPAT